MSRLDAGLSPQPLAALALALLALLAVPGPAQAGKTKAPSPAVLAMTESLSSFCGPLNPAASADLRLRGAELVQGLSEEELAELRNSQEYQAASQSLRDSLGAQDEQALRQLCSGAPAAYP